MKKNLKNFFKSIKTINKTAKGPVNEYRNTDKIFQ